MEAICAKSTKQDMFEDTSRVLESLSQCVQPGRSPFKGNDDIRIAGEPFVSIWARLVEHMIDTSLKN